MSTTTRTAQAKFKWTFTNERGWEGHRLRERILKPEYGYAAYTVELWLSPFSHLDPRRWRWSVVRNYERRGHLEQEHLAVGEVEYGGDVAAARERAMREAEAAYLLLPL